LFLPAAGSAAERHGFKALLLSADENESRDGNSSFLVASADSLREVEDSSPKSVLALIDRLLLDPGSSSRNSSPCKRSAN
jgi:hypothetical protein